MIGGGIEELTALAPVKPRKPKKKSPTQRSLEHMREQGFRCQVVEHWVPHVNIRRDLFGFIDVLCIKDGQVVAIQACSGTDVSKRVLKIVESEAQPDVVKCGWRIVVHGWRKNAKNRWVLREVEL